MEKVFGHAECAQKITFAEEVCTHLRDNRQTSGPEVGGQFFGTIDNNKIIISLATGPRDEDKKSRFRLVVCRKNEQKEIGTLFKKGLHYLGDWHTHPEASPSPSGLDLQSMQECFRKSKHQHGAFLMAIVGNGNEGSWLWVSLHRAKDYLKLAER
jgi:integrative and conjugative element protein (TIGR02256 family)